MAENTLDIASLGTLSPELYAEQQALNRKQQLAQALMQQGFNNQPQGQMVSGRYVAPSFWANLLPIAQMAAGKYSMDKGDKEGIKLAATLRQEKGDAMNQFRTLASDPATMGQAMTLLNTSPYLGDLAKQVNAPRTRKEGEDFVIPGIDGKSITLDKGGEVLPTNVKEAIINLDLPKDRSTWTKEQKTAFQNYIPLEKRIALQQTNARLADEGIGGVSLGGGGPVGGGVPMANVLRGQPIQGQPQGSPQGAPMAPQGGPQAMPQNGPAPNGIAPKDMRKINTDAYAKQLDYFQNQMPQDLKMAEGTLKVIDKMLGDTYINEKGKIDRRVVKDAEGKDVLDKYGKPTKGRDTASGFGSFVGAGVPWLSNMPGTDAANFKSMYDQVNSKAFMEAFGRLKGGGQITEIEGQKATESLLRAKASQSEEEFITAMREFEQDVKDGMTMAKQKGGALPRGNVSVQQSGGFRRIQ